MSDQCAYMRAAYPILSGDDTCRQHRHEPRVFDLARALAVAFQPEPTTDERIAWFLDDADAVVDDFPADTPEWSIVELGAEFDEVGDELPVDQRFTVNGVEYVVPPSEWEPSVPVKRETWGSWHNEEVAR